ncbi:hypothetical protein OBBRIDRAFT_790870 [Obba rivulosa]|uniref:F-box domain-containing protein n=1 Tax=Obba rivulosa TaxID=1052685 RepID=A0A8E2DLS0_9APHY|nr:hypothetical protein OBBRIDRAFT_790870 [Obba rivulosa]
MAQPTATSHCYPSRGHRLQLPSELLFMIFEYVIPPDIFMESTSVYGPSSPWLHSLRIKTTLVQVCKAWRLLALPFLYEQILLHHASQILELARTIRESDSNIATLIKRIHLDCFTPRVPSALDEMTFILREATHLQSFSTGFRFLIGGITHLHRRGLRRFRAVIGGLSDTLTQLGYCAHPIENDVPFNLSLRHIGTFSKLVSLSITLSSSWYTDSKSRPEVRLHRLTELELLCREDADFTVFDPWELPNLRRLWILKSHRESCILTTKHAFPSFLQRHGSGLVFLDLHGMSYPDVGISWDFAKLCPKLRHMVVGCLWSGLNFSEGFFNSSTFFHLDIWTHSVARHQLRRELDAAQSQILRDARLLDVELAHIRRLPLLLPPDMVIVADQVITYRLPSFCIKQSRSLIELDHGEFDNGDTEDEDYKEQEQNVEESDEPSDTGDEELDDTDGYEDTDEELWYIPRVTRHFITP